MANEITPEGEETAESIVEQARASGIEVTRDQLERWHKAGALPHPRQMPLGPGGGSLSLYPPGCARQAMAIVLGLRQTRRLDEVAFAQWIGGAPVETGLVRRYLERVARWHDRLAGHVRDVGFGDAVLPEPAFDLIATLARKHAPDGPGAEVWRRLGSLGDRETLIRIFFDAATGKYVPTPSPAPSIYREESEGLLVERALGIASGRTDSILETGPWLNGSPEDALAQITTILSGDWTRELRSTTDDGLIRARSDVRDLREIIVGLGEAFSLVFGPDAFGFAPMGAMLRSPTPFDDAFLIFAVIRARTHPGLSAKLDVLRAALPQVRELRAISEVASQLRQRTDVGDLFAPDVLRAAFADQLALEQHTRLIEERLSSASDHSEG